MTFFIRKKMKPRRYSRRFTDKEKECLIRGDIQLRALTSLFDQG